MISDENDELKILMNARREFGNQSFYTIFADGWIGHVFGKYCNILSNIYFHIKSMVGSYDLFRHTIVAINYT